MPIRKRFRPAEREAFTAGKRIEVLHSTRWVPCEVDSGVIETDDITGGQYMMITYRGQTTRTVSYGAQWRGYAGHLRTPATAGA
jgi:hypothetical protein